MFLGELREFQQDASDFMLENQSVLLTHRLGLGKTVTTIATVEDLIDLGEAECVLVVCPASIKWQWARQIKKFTDGALVLVIEGTKPERIWQYRLIRQKRVEYVLMNYEQVVNDWKFLRHFEWDIVVADEIQAIKNPNAKRSRFFTRLDAPYKFGLTGQPMENKPEETFAIMEWINPEILGRPDIFDRTFVVRDPYGKVKKYKNLNLFRELMGEAMHRRTRDDVADQLPAIVEESYIIDFDPRAQRLYDRIARELIDAIRETGPRFSKFDIWNHYTGMEKANGAGYAEIMPRLMAMRMLCDHPQLLHMSADNFHDPATKLGSEYAAHLKAEHLLDGVTSIPKLRETLAVIEEILAADRDNKVVVFSFFEPMISQILHRRVRAGSVVFSGRMTARKRDAAILQFQEDPKCRVFLSTDAGGVGVDLPMANFLLSYDLPWSAGKWEQRNGRIDRLSSEFPEITLLSMIMRGSIEERQYDMISQKSRVAEAWLDGKRLTGRGDFKLSLGSLVDFLEAAT